MKNKTIFTAAVLGLFIISAAAGYFGPDWLRHLRMERLQASFTASTVPDDIIAAFGRDFSGIQAATEAKPFPETVFTDASGKKTTISDYAGKPTLVNFWATWCAPCVVELPTLEWLRKEYDGRMNVLAIAIEDPKSPAQIADFLEKRGVAGLGSFTEGGSGFSRQLELRGIPTSFLVGSNGLILYRFEGDANWGSEDSRRFFDSFLSSGI